MVLDALRGYVQLASGLTEVNRQRAVAEAKALLANAGGVEQLLSDQAKGVAGDVRTQVQTLADDLLATSKANRQVFLALVRAEAERAVGSLGLATAEEISALRRKVERLDQKLADTSAAAASPAPAKKAPAKKQSATASAARTTATKKTTTKKTATKAAAKKLAKKTTTTPKDAQ